MLTICCRHDHDPQHVSEQPIEHLISGGGSRVSVWRGALGLDLAVTSAIGLTLGLEFGSNEPPESAKPSGTAFGAAISYSIGARR